MKTLLRLLLVLVSTLPCCLICADGIGLNIAGFAYAGAWVWVVYEILKAYERKESTQADR